MRCADANRSSLIPSQKNPPKQRWEPLRGEGREEALVGLPAGDSGGLAAVVVGEPPAGDQMRWAAVVGSSQPRGRVATSVPGSCPFRVYPAGMQVGSFHSLTSVPLRHPSRVRTGPRSAEAGPREFLFSYNPLSFRSSCTCNSFRCEA